MTRKKKSTKKKAMPKPRHGWEINPKTRVKPSDKIYKRARAKRKTRKDVHGH